MEAVGRQDQVVKENTRAEVMNVERLCYYVTYYLYS